MRDLPAAKNTDREKAGSRAADMRRKKKLLAAACACTAVCVFTALKDNGTVSGGEFAERDAGCAALASHVRANPVPMLAANLVPERDCPLASAGIAPFRIFAFEGRRVAVVGLANDEVRVIARACPHTRFAGAEKSLRDAVERLQGEGIDIIIGLSHLGLERDIELARAVQGLDIIVGGHTHSYLGPKVDGAPESEGPYPLVEHGPDGKTVLVVTAFWATHYLGLLHVSFDEAGVPVAWSGGPMELGPDLPRDERVARYVAQAAEKVESCRKVSLGHSDLVFADGLDACACRAGDCLAGLVTTDAMLDYARPHGADIALYNGGGFRAGIPLGSVSLGSVLDILPFGNRLFLRTYKGAQVLAALEHGVAGSRLPCQGTDHFAVRRACLQRGSPGGARAQGE